MASTTAATTPVLDEPGGRVRPGPGSAATVLVLLAACTAVLVLVVAADRSGPRWATSPVLVGSAVVTAVGLTRLRGAAAGWPALRRALTGLAGAVLAVPGWWAAASTASERAPDGVVAWATAVVATTAHLPLVAAFSLLPLLCVRYLGTGSSRWPVGVVLGLMAATFVSFAAFFDDFPVPLAARAPSGWDHGPALGAVVHAVFLATVLLGPGAALVGAGREPERPAGRRLRTAGLAAVAGAVLVMGCGVVSGAGDVSLSPDVAAVAMYVSAFAAVLVVAAGTVRALRTDDTVPVDLRGAPAEPTPDNADAASAAVVDARGAPGAGTTEVAPAPAVDPPTRPPAQRSAAIAALTPRENEVLGLLALGLSNVGIAVRLTVSTRTVDAHLRSVFAKLDLPDDPTENRRVHAALAVVDASAAAGATSSSPQEGI